MVTQVPVGQPMPGIYITGGLGGHGSGGFNDLWISEVLLGEKQMWHAAFTHAYHLSMEHLWCYLYSRYRLSMSFWYLYTLKVYTSNYYLFSEQSVLSITFLVIIFQKLESYEFRCCSSQWFNWSHQPHRTNQPTFHPQKKSTQKSKICKDLARSWRPAVLAAPWSVLNLGLTCRLWVVNCLVIHKGGSCLKFQLQ